MRKIRDFFYNCSDIIAALVILLAAVTLIYWRVNIILDYPATLAAENTIDLSDTEKEVVIEQTPLEKESSKADDGPADSTVWRDGKLRMNVLVEIEPGSSESAIETLVSAGLFSSYEEFVELCKKSKIDPEHIQAREFTFDAGSTQLDIIKIVTNN